MEHGFCETDSKSRRRRTSERNADAVTSCRVLRCVVNDAEAAAWLQSESVVGVDMLGQCASRDMHTAGVHLLSAALT